MFCRNCGTQLKDDAVFCHNCGTAVNGQTSPPAQSTNQPTYQQPIQNQQPATSGTNTVAIVGFVFSFLIALVGLICSIVGYNNSKKGAPYGGLAIAGIIIAAVNMFLGIILATTTRSYYLYFL